MTTHSTPNVTTYSDRESWRGKSIEERLAKMSSIFIEHEGVKKLMAHIESQLLIAQARGKSSATLVVAASGAGKSTFIKYLSRKYPDKVTEEVRLRPLVHFRIPSSPTPKQMGKAFLKALGDPLYNVGDAEEKKERIATLLVECKTQIIAIDDFQDVPARSGVQGVKDAGDWVRDICEMEGFTGTLLAFGTEDAAVVRDSNDQLTRRMMSRIDLATFEINSAKGSREFLSLLGLIDKLLPIAESSDLKDPDTARRIFFACGGNFDYLMKLLVHALILAVKERGERIERHHLLNGFVALHQVAAHEGNPFTAEWSGASLDAPGQIFHRTTVEDKSQGKAKRRSKE